MDQSKFNEAYKANNMITTYPPAPPVASIFVQSAQLAAQHRAKQYQRDANNRNTFGTRITSINHNE